MTKAISEDLRSRVIASVEGGLSRRAAADRFGVAASSAVRWLREALAHGRAVAGKPGGDQRSCKTDAHADLILTMLEQNGDITLAEIRSSLAGRSIHVGAPSTVWRFLDRHAMTVKKNGTRQRAATARRARAATRLVQEPA